MIGQVTCNKGGYHQGQPVNMICNNPECSNQMMCCNICIQEFHSGHQTKSLKKLLIEAQNKSNNNKKVKSSTKVVNTDIVENMMQMRQKQTRERFDQMKNSVNYLLQKIESNIQNYFKSALQSVLEKNLGQSSIQSLIHNVNSGTDIETLQKNVKKLNFIMEHDTPDDNFLSENELIDAMNSSNNQIQQFINMNFGKLIEKLAQYEKSFSLLTSGSNLVQKSFTFSKVYKHTNVEIANSFQVVSKGPNGYKFAVMEPSIENKGKIVCLNFKIKKSTGNWLAFGLCHLNTVQQNGYSFDHSKIGHGTYMISSNAGSWHHSNEQLNNKVLSFSFKTGDQVSCFIDTHQGKMMFISKLETYYMKFNIIPGNPLYPCVAFYYQNDHMEYLPKIFSGDVPRYLNNFSKQYKSNTIQLVSEHTVRSTAQGYCFAIMTNDLQKKLNPVQRFAFRIMKTSGQNPWVAVGVCHRKIVASKKYEFDYQGHHGSFMVSSNGGSWSHLDPENNNKVKAFKFGQGDTILVKVDFWNKKVVFKRKQDTFSLSIDQQENDPLCPCVCFHYPNDVITFLPDFDFDY